MVASLSALATCVSTLQHMLAVFILFQKKTKITAFTRQQPYLAEFIGPSS